MRILPRPNWPFQIVEEPSVTQAIVNARQTWPRFEDIWDGIVWLIAHRGHKIGAVERDIGDVGHYIYTFEGDTVAGFPRIVVVYRYHLEYFTLRMILVSKPSAE